MRDKIAFTILRVGLGVVFLIFGIGKFQDDIWAQTIKGMEIFQSLPWSVDLTVLLIGASEVTTGVFLILGVFTRLFSMIASLQLMTILILLHFQEMRDVGLLGAAVYMAVAPHESFGFQRVLECCFRHNKRKE